MQPTNENMWLDIPLEQPPAPTSSCAPLTMVRFMNRSLYEEIVGGGSSLMYAHGTTIKCAYGVEYLVDHVTREAWPLASVSNSVMLPRSIATSAVLPTSRPLEHSIPHQGRARGSSVPMKGTKMGVNSDNKREAEMKEKSHFERQKTICSRVHCIHSNNDLFSRLAQLFHRGNGDSVTLTNFQVKKLRQIPLLYDGYMRWVHSGTAAQPQVASPHQSSTVVPFVEMSAPQQTVPVLLETLVVDMVPSVATCAPLEEATDRRETTSPLRCVSPLMVCSSLDVLTHVAPPNLSATISPMPDCVERPRDPSAPLHEKRSRPPSPCSNEAVPPPLTVTIPRAIAVRVSPGCVAYCLTCHTLTLFNATMLNKHLASPEHRELRDPKGAPLRAQLGSVVIPLPEYMGYRSLVTANVVAQAAESDNNDILSLFDLVQPVCTVCSVDISVQTYKIHEATLLHMNRSK